MLYFFYIWSFSIRLGDNPGDSWFSDPIYCFRSYQGAYVLSVYGRPEDRNFSCCWLCLICLMSVFLVSSIASYSPPETPPSHICCAISHVIHSFDFSVIFGEVIIFTMTKSLIVLFFHVTLAFNIFFNFIE